MTVQDRFRQHLSLGHVDRARRLLGEGASLCLEAGEEHERYRLFAAAAAAPTVTALDWLWDQSEARTLANDYPVSLIAALMNGYNSYRNMAVADWMIDHMEVIPRVDFQVHREWFQQALRRDDAAAVAWLLHPPPGLPRLVDTPESPLLNAAMAHMNMEPERRLPILRYLLAEGIPARVDEGQGDFRGHSPLSLLLRLYEQHLTRANPEKGPLPQMVQALWGPLVHAGDDPWRKAPDSDHALRDRLLATPLAGLVQAQERFVALPPAPTRERRRPRA